MGRADSIDLRKRVVAAVETGGLSRLQAAAQFEARRFLWIQRFRRTSNVKPIRMGGYKPRQIAGRLTTTGWCADAGRPTSPCADWSPNWARAAEGRLPSPSREAPS